MLISEKNNIDINDFYFLFHGFIFCMVEEVYRLGLDKITPEQIVSSLEKSHYNVEELSNIFLEMPSNNLLGDIQMFTDNSLKRQPFEPGATNGDISKITIDEGNSYSIVEYRNNELYQVGLAKDNERIAYNLPNVVKFNLQSTLQALEALHYQKKASCLWYENPENISEYIYYV